MSVAVDRQSYRVVVTREGEHWLADVEGLAGAHTFARNLESLDRFVREVVVLAADLHDEAAGGLVLDWEYQTGDAALDARLRELRRERRELDHLRARVESDTAGLALELAGRLSVRDSAAMLGVSRARAQQLIGSPAGRG